MAKLLLISIGPGDLSYMLPAAKDALQTVDVIIGYEFYLTQIEPLRLAHQTVEVSQLGSEVARAERAVEIAKSGTSVAMVSSGDIGIYAMASPIFDVLHEENWDGHSPEVIVYPGVSAIQATSARLGATLGHDFCTISLSNLMTPWAVIERRLEAAAWGDFVIGFYNPRSKRRDWQLDRAKEILLDHRDPNTPVVISFNVTRETEKLTYTTLGELDVTQVDMFSMVLVGNSQSYKMHDRVVTPRGYLNEEEIKEKGLKVDKPVESEIQPSTLYPLTLNKMDEKHAVVIGGGPVGARKVQGLLNASCAVTLISPDATTELATLAEQNKLTWHKRNFEQSDLHNADLIFAATNDRNVNAQIAAVAKERGILCNVADAPEEGDFHSPATLRQAGLIVSVNNESRQPKRAVKVRDRIKRWLK